MQGRAYEILVNTAARTGWNAESMTDVLCEFIDGQSLTVLENFRQFLKERERLEFQATRKQLRNKQVKG